MLSRLDDIIYPNRCEVIEIEASHRYIYPIFKNGSSSITEYAAKQKYKILLNEQIKRIDTIDVVLREPTARYVSGIRTFVHNIKRDNPQLDLATILYFAENYLFLNRHYAPQLSWLVQLSRYTTTDTKLKFVGMESLSDYTPLSVSPPETIAIDYKISSNVHNEMYIRLDNLLMNLIGQVLTFKEILDYIKQQDPVAYQKLKCIALD